MIEKPNLADTPAYFRGYIDLVPENNLLDALDKNLNNTIYLFENVSEEKENFAYAEGKWTIKEVLNHIIDTERIFAYRALRFSRLDETDLPGYDENLFTENANVSHRSLQHLIEEFRVIRKSTHYLFEAMTNEMLDFVGTANKSRSSARALGFMIIGHAIHHNHVLKERYLK